MKKAIIAVIILSVSITFFMLNFLLVRNYTYDMLPAIDKDTYVFIKRSSVDKANRLDIIAYHFPGIADKKIIKKPVHISRLIGLPGDTVEIRNKSVFVNNSQIDKNLDLFFEYRISIDKTFDPGNLKDFNTLHESEIVKDKAWELHTSPDEASKIAKLEGVTNVRFLSDLRRDKDYEIFPVSQFFNWNKDHYGPVVIPEAGEPLQLNYMNIKLYKRLIGVYEGHKIYLKHRKIFIDGEEVSQFTPEKNYYFVMDDNRDNCKDSRHWGFLPSDHFAGIKVFQDNE
ncbi:MAG: signal peptidase I [Bacteroidota bacterium]